MGSAGKERELAHASLSSTSSGQCRPVFAGSPSLFCGQSVLTQSSVVALITESGPVTATFSSRSRFGFRQKCFPAVNSPGGQPRSHEVDTADDVSAPRWDGKDPPRRSAWSLCLFPAPTTPHRSAAVPVSVLTFTPEEQRGSAVLKNARAFRGRGLGLADATCQRSGHRSCSGVESTVSGDSAIRLGAEALGASSSRAVPPERRLYSPPTVRAEGLMERSLLSLSCLRGLERATVRPWWRIRLLLWSSVIAQDV